MQMNTTYLRAVRQIKRLGINPKKVMVKVKDIIDEDRRVAYLYYSDRDESLPYEECRRACLNELRTAGVGYFTARLLIPKLWDARDPHPCKTVR